MADTPRPSLLDLVREIAGLRQGVFALDPEWRYVFINAEAEQLVGRSFGSLHGKVIWEEFPEAVGSPFDKAYRRAMERRETVFLKEYFEPLDRWYEITVVPHGGRGIVIVFDDVTAAHNATALLALRGSELLDPEAGELLARLRGEA